ncbi:MAG: hypothetical protein ABIJ00_10370 [Candidatus Eisenbacteria bacterium]
MKHRADAVCRARAGQPSFSDQLHRQGAYRWIALIAALALLAWLWMFAGEARHPEGVKRQWAVMASRILAVAGGLFLVRLLLFSHEERIPVIFIASCGAGAVDGTIGDRIKTVTALRHKGHEVIPLRDVVMFIRAHRFLPGRCFGLVVEGGSPEEFGEILSAAGDTAITILLAPEVLKRCEDRPVRRDLPETVTLGTVLTGHEKTEEELVSFADLAGKVVGKKAEYAVVQEGADAPLRTVLKSTGYTSFLGGGGYNRFHDESQFIRVLDVSHVLGSRSAGRLRTSLEIALFKGRYIVWPLAAVCRMACAR